MNKGQNKKLLAIYAVLVASLALSIGLAPRLALADESEALEQQQITEVEDASSDEEPAAPATSPEPPQEASPVTSEPVTPEPAPEAEQPAVPADDAAPQDAEPATPAPAEDTTVPAPEDTPALTEDPAPTDAPAAPAEAPSEEPTEPTDVSLTAEEDDPVPVRTVADGLYEIKVGKSGNNAAAVSGSSKADSASIVSGASNGSAAQRFFIEYAGEGYYSVYNLNSGKKLTVDSSNNVVQAASSETAAQLWAILANAGGTFSLKNKETGLLMTLASANLVGRTDTVNASGVRGNSQQMRLTRVDLLVNGYYTITSAANAGLRIEVSGGSASKDAKIVLAKSAAGAKQTYQVVRVGGVGSGRYRIRTASSGGWLTETGSSSTSLVKQIGNSKTPVSDANTWEVCWNGAHWSFRNVESGYILSFAGPEAGKQLKVHRPNGEAKQHFEFAPTTLVTPGYYIIKSSSNNKVLTVKNSSVRNGGNIIVAKNKRDDNQKFQFKKIGDYYYITNFYSSKRVQVKGASKKDAANVQQWASKNNKNQKWDIQIADGGGLLFVNVNSGRVFTVASKNNVNQQGVNSTNRQSWSLIATKVSGWYRVDGHWRYKSTTKGARFDNDINSKGESLGHYDVLRDIWKQIKNKRSKTKYLIASSWDCCYVAIFEGRRGNWRPLKGFNCGNGSPGVIESKVREKNPESTWQWSPVWDRYLALSNTKGRMPELPPENSWAAKLGTTFKSSRVLRVNANERYFTSVSWTLGYHTYLHSKKELGRHLSNGCQRLQPKYAKWIYENAGPGTRCTQIRTRSYA